MNKYVAGEVAYQNGYKFCLKILEDEYSLQFIKGFLKALIDTGNKQDDNNIINDLLEILEKRYDHLKIQYGNQDNYVIGFNECMNIIKNKK